MARAINMSRPAAVPFFAEAAVCVRVIPVYPICAAQRIRQAKCAATPQFYPPVLILYGTAFATQDDRILFFDDLYGHDAKLAALLRL